MNECLKVYTLYLLRIPNKKRFQNISIEGEYNL